MGTETRFYDPKPRPMCPICDCESDVAQGAEGTTPRDGDASFCLYCGTVRAFVMEGHRLIGFRVMSEVEIAADPEGRQRIARVRASYPQFLMKCQEDLKGRDHETLSPGQRQILRTADTIPVPTCTASPVGEMTLTGKLFAWHHLGIVSGEPVLLRMPSSPFLYPLEGRVRFSQVLRS